jgi:uncharacterized membrane protein
MPRTAAQNLSDVPPATPGVFTSEFWKTAAFVVVSLLIATGVITPVDAQKYKPIVDGLALIAPAIAIGFYSMSRGKTKAAAIEAAANVVMTKQVNDTQLLINRVAVPSNSPSVPTEGAV